MYQGELSIYLVGLDDENVQALRAVPALAPFTHRFVSAPVFDAHVALDADLTLVSLGREVDTWVLQDFLEDKEEHCDVIALVAPERFGRDDGPLAEHLRRLARRHARRGARLAFRPLATAS